MEEIKDMEKATKGCFEFLNSDCRLIIGRVVYVRVRAWVRITVRVRIRDRVRIRVRDGGLETC